LPGNEAGTRETRNSYKLSVEKPQRKESVARIRVNKGIILKEVFRKSDIMIYAQDSVQWRVCKYGNEQLGSIEDEESFGLLRDYELLRKDFYPWTYYLSVIYYQSHCTSVAFKFIVNSCSFNVQLQRRAYSL
jgi:hypothetical protein